MTARARDRGAADALGLVLLAPAVVGLALLVVALGRDVDARAQVRSAAEAAAQAAALERSPSVARAAAERVATAMLVDADACATPRITVDRPAGAAVPGSGATIAVTVECAVSDRGLEVVRPGSREIRVTAYATVDVFRGSEP